MLREIGKEEGSGSRDRVQQAARRWNGLLDRVQQAARRWNGLSQQGATRIRHCRRLGKSRSRWNRTQRKVGEGVGTVGSHPGIVDSHPGTVGEVGHSQSDNHEIDVASMGHSMGKDDTVHSNHSTLQESRASHMLQSLAWAHGTNAQPRTAPRLGTLPHKLPTGQAT